MNRKNIQKVRDHIAGLNPKRFNMALWAAERDGDDDVAPVRLKHDCGTCGCIGGWTDAIFRTPRSKMGAESAGRALGLTEDQAQALFFPWGFPWGVNDGDDWENIKPAHAVRVLDHLLATGEVDWRSTRRTKKAAA